MASKQPQSEYKQTNTHTQHHADERSAQSPTSRTPRALAPDLARGFMLLLIAIANVSAYLWGHEMSLESVHPVDGSAIDRALAAAAIVFIDARVYPMFAFLFGYGMVQFARTRAERGIPAHSVMRMLLRRHVWLIVFGVIHAALLFSGDILGAYGLAGLVLAAIFFNRTDRVLKITVWVFVGVVALSAAFALLGGVIVSLLPPELAAMGAADTDLFGSASLADLMNGEANYLVAMLIRIGLWIAGTIGPLLTLIVPACILLGWLAARHQWLETPGVRPRLGVVALWGITISVVGALPSALSYLGLLPFFESAGWAFSGIAQLTGIAGGIGYAALFGVIAHRIERNGHPATAPVGAVAAVGKRSLSSYLLQSVIFAPLLAAWGFGLGAEIGTAQAYAIAIGVWALSLILATVLERSGRQGPAERVLRKLTYRSDDPNR